MEAQKARVVIVEDDPRQRQLMGIVLSSEGYTVQSAADGEEGLRMVRTALPDLVITDVMMPKLTGFELCRHMRLDPRTALIPIIFVTAHKSEKDYREGFSLGADDYVTKPWARPELVGRIEAALQRVAASRRRSPSLTPAWASSLGDPDPGPPGEQPVKPSEPPRVLLGGELTTVSILEVLQTLGWSALSGRLEIHGKDPGFIELRSGQLIRAEVKTPRRVLQGEKAWLRLVNCAEGTFELWGSASDPALAEEAGSDLNSRLMSAAVERDEFQRLREIFPPQGLMMLRRRQLPRDATLLEQRIWQLVEVGIELDAILDELPDPDLEILRSVARLMMEKAIGGKPLQAKD